MKREQTKIPLQYSLLTLILASFWCGTAMWVWAWREPWVEASIRNLPAKFDAKIEPMPKSPDKCRCAYYDDIDGETIVCDIKELEIILLDGRKYPGDPWPHTLFVIPDPGNGPQVPWRFTSDDDLEFIREGFEKKLVTFHRRHPEWWWGHFCRPEVWLLLALSGLLIWTAARWRKALKARNEKDGESERSAEGRNET